jgi:hypothetical protein
LDGLFSSPPSPSFSPGAFAKWLTLIRLLLDPAVAPPTTLVVAVPRWALNRVSLFFALAPVILARSV